MTNHGGAGEPDTDNVLWRRHERSSDRIWIPGANITFRSAITATILAQANFPVINDPCPPPPATCPAGCFSCAGQLGDIIDPQINGTELGQAVAACNTAWNTLTAQFNTPNLGPIALNIGRFVDQNNNPTNLAGWGGFTSSNAGANTCANPPTGLTSAIGGSATVVDNQVFETPNGAVLAHELGHVLQLWHGNGVDDDMNGLYDQCCDAAENVNAPPANLMAPIAGSGVLTALQSGTAGGVAGVYSGVQRDPPGTLVSGDTIGDQRVDPAQDVPDASVDLVWLAMTENTPTETTTLSHGLFGLIPLATRQYLVFADLDGNAGTGGAPSSLGFPTSFQGAELVTRVVVEPSGEFGLSATPTVWKFQGGTFVEVNDPQIRAKEDAPVGGENMQPQPLFAVVSIQIPNAVVGPIAKGCGVRIQGIAQQTDGQLLDQLPDGPTDGGVNFCMVAPQFPTCSLTPGQVQRGDTPTVAAKDLRPNETAKVILGDEMVATGLIDAAGNVSASFAVPSNAREGVRLVTVGVMGTALTADCPLLVGGPVVCGDGFVGAGEECDDGNTANGDGCSSTCQIEEIKVPVDVKPTSCPNPLNTGDKGVLPVAILGTSSLDVTQVDATTVQLEGVSPLQSALEDVATPFVPFAGKVDCSKDCATAGPDGFVDLTLRFDTQAVVAALGSVKDKDCLALKLTGKLLNGLPIVGEDVVVILKK